MSSFMLTICGYILCGFIGLLSGTIIWFIWTDKINISALLAEANGRASLSRFQLLVFTMVVATSFFYLVEKNASCVPGKDSNCPSHSELPEIPSSVLTLLGISASTYAVGKGISYSRDEGVMNDSDKERAHEERRESIRANAMTSATPVIATDSNVTINPPANRS